ncbi:MAG: glycosyltransferase family 4 protein [Phycisphaerales bacterium]|nr:glycosyltransferase family 4 protein [Phycisphaerales bacterium]
MSAISGKPLVVHVHSTEFDRSGQNVNPPVYDLERRGLHGAIRVIAVSHLTKSILIHRYGLDESKIDVVYNGIESEENPATASRASIARTDKVVLFLGRITWQKRP